MKHPFAKFASGCVAAAALMGTPLAAQNDRAEMEEMMSAMQKTFPADALTAEEEAKLPAATEAVAKVIPDGIYARMMKDVMGGMFGALAGQLTTMPVYEMAVKLGLPSEAVSEYDDTTRAEITTLIDPAFAQRGKLSMEAMSASLTGIMAGMEPDVRSGLARAYAHRFTAQQLSDINTFFATPTGAVYASESMLVFTDPQAMAASMDAMPKVMDALPTMMESVANATADLPPERGFADLSESERTRLAALTGLSIEELAAGMETQMVADEGSATEIADDGEYGSAIVDEVAE